MWLQVGNVASTVYLPLFAKTEKSIETKLQKDYEMAISSVVQEMHFNSHIHIPAYALSHLRRRLKTCLTDCDTQFVRFIIYC